MQNKDFDWSCVTLLQLINSFINNKYIKTQLTLLKYFFTNRVHIKKSYIYIIQKIILSI